MIALFLRPRHEVGEAIDHHAGLGDDADDDTQDVCSRRYKAIGEEEPDGVDAKRDVDPERADQETLSKFDNVSKFVIEIIPCEL